MKLKAKDSLTELETGVARLMEIRPADAISVELRDHILDTYQRVISNLLKSQLKIEDKAIKADKDW
jgi:hypothetical protein